MEEAEKKKIPLNIKKQRSCTSDVSISHIFNTVDVWRVEETHVRFSDSQAVPRVTCSLEELVSL